MCEILVNKDLRLNETEALEGNCPNFPSIRGPSYYVTVGGVEPSGWTDQSEEMAMLLNKRDDNVTLQICQNLNHFTIFDQLCDGTNQEGVLLKD